MEARAHHVWTARAFRDGSEHRTTLTAHTAQVLPMQDSRGKGWRELVLQEAQLLFGQCMDKVLDTL